MVSHPMRLLRGLAGRVLPCGCLVGIYETYNSGIIATIDARGPLCDQAGHQLHSLVDLPRPAVPCVEDFKSVSAGH